MRVMKYALALSAALGALPALAHGPQIQITRDNNGEIITRRLIAPVGDNYPAQLTPQTSVYVMPLAEYNGVWRAQPNGALLPNGDPEFLGWPGFMYGHGYDPVPNPQPFPQGSRFTLGFADALKEWNAATMMFGGSDSELEAYRGTPEVVARTSDTAPFQSIMFPGASGINFALEQENTHNTVNYRMLGNGTSTASPLDDGIYLLNLQLSNTADSTVIPSDPFYFVLHKGVSRASVMQAVASLGFDPAAVQFVPEPASLAFLGIFVCGLAINRMPRRRT